MQRKRAATQMIAARRRRKVEFGEEDDDDDLLKNAGSYLDEEEEPIDPPRLVRANAMGPLQRERAIFDQKRLRFEQDSQSLEEPTSLFEKAMQKSGAHFPEKLVRADPDFNLALSPNLVVQIGKNYPFAKSKNPSVAAVQRVGLFIFRKNSNGNEYVTYIEEEYISRLAKFFNESGY